MMGSLHGDEDVLPKDLDLVQANGKEPSKKKLPEQSPRKISPVSQNHARNSTATNARQRPYIAKRSPLLHQSPAGGQYHSAMPTYPALPKKNRRKVTLQ